MNKGLFLGSHMSIAGGVDRAPERGASVGCSAMQIFVKNNTRWDGPPITEKQAAAFAAELDRAGIARDKVFAHACYLINLASPKEDHGVKSMNAIEDELRRCDQIGLPGLVMHPGAPLESGRDAGIEAVAKRCRAVFKRTPDVKARLLFETTAGTGSNLGAKFEDLRDLMAAVDMPDRVGVCMDTCHIFAAGYDLRTRAAYDETMAAFDRIVGFKNLHAVHLNDSKHDLGTRKDRHEHIGAGFIGRDAFGFLLNDPRFRNLPMSLETHKGEDLAEDRMNLGVLRELIAEIAKPKKAKKTP